jgi:succinyl-diaminopimelate desuccinylase
VTGVQGHSAYPHRARNPVHAIARLMDRLASHELDRGTEHFDASTLAVTTIDTGNPASNVIPARATATVNIRFNDTPIPRPPSPAGSRPRRPRSPEATGCGIGMEVRVSGESFLTPPGPADRTSSRGRSGPKQGLIPAFSTTGGTSDARFVKDHCPVVEFGLPGRTMHQVDERVPVEDIRLLKTGLHPHPARLLPPSRMTPPPGRATSQRS